MKTVTETDYRARIDRVVKAISDDPVRPRSLRELAHMAHFSPFHFHRIYRAIVGESVVETARRMRLVRAAHLLATTRSAVTEVAMDVGYESVQTFSRAFGAFTTVAPSVFRSKRMQLAKLVKGPEQNYRGGRESYMQVEIVERKAEPTLVVRHKGPMTEVKETYDKLWRWQLEHGLTGRIKEAIGICYGDPAAEADDLYYAGVFASEAKVPAGGGVELHEVPGGKYASYRLVGPYDGIPAAFQRLYGEWLPKSGDVPDDRPALEIYRNNPYDTPANELITDLLVPVR